MDTLGGDGCVYGPDDGFISAHKSPNSWSYIQEICTAFYMSIISQ